jgi:hypothetical protein
LSDRHDPGGAGVDGEDAWRIEAAEEEARRRALRDERRAALRNVHRRRQLTAVVALVLLVGGISSAFVFTGGGGPPAPSFARRPTTAHAARSLARHVAMPAQVRGVHVSLYVAGDPKRMAALRSLARPGGHGLNTLEIDVKDEAGIVGFTQGVPALARRTHAAAPYYDPRLVVSEAHKRGIYVIGRIVCFEDPKTSEHDPALAIRTRGGGVWTNAAGLGWANPYSRKDWAYLIALGKDAARQGFDEIQFDYVRFPTDGDLSQAVFPGKLDEPYSATLLRFLTAATHALHPLHVNVSADVFGLAAAHDLGIGQNVRRIGPLLDAISPMAYPSHYGAGEYNLPNPDDAPFLTVLRTMQSFKSKLGTAPTRLRPWLQDFTLPGERRYTVADVRQQIRAARMGGASGWLLWNAGVEYSKAVFDGT